MTRVTLLGFLLAALPLHAAGDEREVLAVAHRLFDAMAAHDENALRSILAPEGHIYSIRADKPVAVSTAAEFATRIGASKEALLERIWKSTILVEDRIATLWAPYDFHRGGKLSHCGIDSFTFMKTSEGWKITGLFFTVVDPAGCSSSPLGPPPVR